MVTVTALLPHRLQGVCKKCGCLLATLLTRLPADPTLLSRLLQANDRKLGREQERPLTLKFTLQMAPTLLCVRLPARNRFTMKKTVPVLPDPMALVTLMAQSPGRRGVLLKASKVIPVPLLLVTGRIAETLGPTWHLQPMGLIPPVGPLVVEVLEDLLVLVEELVVVSFLALTVVTVVLNLINRVLRAAKPLVTGVRPARPALVPRPTLLTFVKNALKAVLLVLNLANSLLLPLKSL